MTIEDIEDAFDEQAGIDGGTLTLGDRSPCPVLVPDGIARNTSRESGQLRESISLRAVCKRSDLGTPPRAKEAASLTYDGDEYELFVEMEGESEQVRGLYEFTLER